MKTGSARKRIVFTAVVCVGLWVLVTAGQAQNAQTNLPSPTEPPLVEASSGGLVFSPGFMNLDIWDNIPTVQVSALTGDPRYPNSPDARFYMGAFDTRTVFPTDARENYGGRIGGFFVPPTSGNWILYLRSDDASELWLDLNDGAGLVKVQEETGCCGTFAGHATAPLPLIGGTRYAVMGLYKEGGGGDYMQVAAKLDTDPTNPNTLRPLNGTAVGIYVSSAGVSIAVYENPADQLYIIGTTPAYPSFTVGVNATVPGYSNPPLTYQWYRDDVAIPGANSASYSLNPNAEIKLSDSGAKFHATVYTLGGQASSAKATLTVVRPNTPPQFTCGPNQRVIPNAGPWTVTNWATGIQNHSSVRPPTTYANDFNAGAAGMNLFGVANVAAGVLKLTTELIAQYGAASLGTPAVFYGGLDVHWKSLLGGGAGGGADGYSLNIGSDVPADPTYSLADGRVAEDGAGSGLTVTVDTFDNGTGQDIGVDIKWGGNNRVAYALFLKDDDGSGRPVLRKSAFVDAHLTLDAAGVATMNYDGTTIGATLPNYTGLTVNRALFWARTGGASDNQWIDDFVFTAFPYYDASSEASQTLQFIVTNDNPALFSVQPAVSPNGTLTYTVAPNRIGSAMVTVIAKDNGGTAYGGRDTSEPCSFTIVSAPLTDWIRVRSVIGSPLVRIAYDLTPTNASSAQISLAVSLNGGASYDHIPAPGSLTGDIGAGVPAGTRTLYWNAAQTLPPGTFNANCKVKVIATAGGVTASAVSPRFAVEVPGANSTLTVSGRALDAQTGVPSSGATVTFGGQSVITSANGDYTFNNVSLASGSTLVISQPGQPAHTETISVAAGTRNLVVRDVHVPPATVPGKPVVTRITATVDGIFLDGADILCGYTASVNWNGGLPGVVRFFANDTLIAMRSGSGPEYTAFINLRTAFPPSLRPGANRLRVVATSAANAASDPKDFGVYKIPLPSALEYVTGYYPFVLQLENVSINWEIPKQEIKTVIDLPWLGKFGAEFKADVSVDYDIPSGEWELQLGLGSDFDVPKSGARPIIPGLARVPKMKLYLGNEEAEFRVYGKTSGRASPTIGWEWNDFEVGISLATRFELTRYGVADLITPGFSTVLRNVPALEQALKNTSIIVWAKPEFSGAAVLTPFPEFDFKRFEIGGKLGIEAAYEPEFTKNVRARVYLGGEPSVTFQMPGEMIKEARFRVYAGIEAQAYFFVFGPHEVALLEWNYPGGPAGATLMAASWLSKLESEVLRVASRGYLANGSERFLGVDGIRAASATGPQTLTPLEAFRLMGKSPSVLAGLLQAASAGSGSGMAQADLPLIQNVYPESQPALAGRGQELMLLYVADNGGSNSLQFTDIKWTRYDGTNWTAPAAILTDTRAEFAPQVAFDGNGDAIAVWERVATTNFNQVDLTALVTQMEIVWSRWSRTNGTWTTPAALSANNYLDHAPLLCGPMSNSDVLLVWTHNTENQLIGTNATGAAGNSDVLWSRWNTGNRTWDTPQTLVANLPFRLSQSLAGTGNRALYAWARDLDGVLTNATDQQVFYCEWSNGVWSATTQFTSNALGNQNIRTAVGPAGDAYLVWRAGANLVMNRNFTATNLLVRSDAQTAGFLDVAMTLGPAGNLALVWQEMGDAGSDPHYRIYDPTSDSWSEDARLFADASLERSFAPVWDDVGNLTLAYNRVGITKTNKSVALEGGGFVTITNVPQPSRVDLAVVKRKLIRDLGLQAGDFSVKGENFMPNAALTLTAQIRNLGDLAVSNATVGFYHGNPASGGVLLTNVPVVGWLPGASNFTASAFWIVPESGVTQSLYAVVDPNGLVAEFNETNNVQSVSVGGVDLAVSVISTEVETNGALRLIAQVQNAGAPGAIASQLALRRAGETNAPLATAVIPALEPGRLAQVALDLPPGSLLEGETALWLRADDAAITSDVNPANNVVSFTVNLFVDSDGDGAPNQWELASGLNPNDASDASADSDGDGVSNLAEYLSGTDPQSVQSYLRLSSIAGSPGAGAQVTWGSVNGRLYTLLRSAALANGFTPLARHIQSTPPQNVFLDSSATNAGPYFYRLQLE